MAQLISRPARRDRVLDGRQAIPASLLNSSEVPDGAAGRRRGRHGDADVRAAGVLGVDAPYPAAVAIYGAMTVIGSGVVFYETSVSQPGLFLVGNALGWRVGTGEG